VGYTMHVQASAQVYYGLAARAGVPCASRSYSIFGREHLPIYVTRRIVTVVLACISSC
jgi:hypothetical protein